jgi:predicted GIY-YIG superfamily endonuclease
MYIHICLYENKKLSLPDKTYKTILHNMNDGIHKTNNINTYSMYLLQNTSNNRTYVGITNNLERRIRQHNGIIKGGAKYTHNFKGTGVWKYYMYISNLSKCDALSFERSVKNTKCSIKGLIPIDKRILCINKYLYKFPNCIIHKCKLL